MRDEFWGKKKNKKRLWVPGEEVQRGKALKLFTGGLKCETNDFVTLVKPRGGMAARAITVRQRAGN